MIFDTHCHLNDEQLISRLDEIIKSANEKDVLYMLVVGWDYESSLKAVKIANKYENVFAAVGYHPENIKDLNDELLYKTLALSNNEKVVAIGEIGLDYHYEINDEIKAKQKEFFIKQIEFAEEHHLPVSIHSRDASKDTMDILKMYSFKYSGILHCFSGSVEMMKEVIKLNLYCGFGGPLTFKNAKTVKEVCKEIPLNRLVLETDCPYLTPHPHRGEINEPKYLPLVADECAKIKGISRNMVDVQTTLNAYRLFKRK